jgi:hypothetical protein
VENSQKQFKIQNIGLFNNYLEFFYSNIFNELFKSNLSEHE